MSKKQHNKGWNMGAQEARSFAKATNCSTLAICGYSLGECANSLVMNSISTFALLYYTQALGLNPMLAGLAMSIAVIWDAVSDPIMGFVTDNTNSRYGRRHPYILLGGLSMAGLLYAVWAVPAFIQTSEIRIFIYLVVMNILLRTALTIFFVPYCAVGFEMATGYEGRAKIQGMRQTFNMIANFMGPALAWAFFFPSLADGSKATGNAENYLSMGMVFSIAIIVLTLLTTIFTYKYRTNGLKKSSKDSSVKGLKHFIRTNKAILVDKYARCVYIFAFFGVLNMVIVSSLLTFFYIYFMKIEGADITIAQFCAVIGSALGGLMATRLPHWFEKEGSILIACGMSIVSNLIVAIFLLTGWLSPSSSSGFIFFIIMNGIYWMGSGIMIPTAVAMIADIAEINQYKTGELKDGSYAAFYSFIFKFAISVALLISGALLNGIGFDVNAESQSSSVIWNLGATMLLTGPIICIFAAISIFKYKVTKLFLNSIRGENQVSNHRAPLL